jgi:hypothetical protein
VNIDWSEKWSGPLPEHVWLHDYPKMFADAGMRCAAFLLPQKVDGKQQRLFVAAPELPTGIAWLEEHWTLENCPEGESMPGEIDPWSEQLQLAVTEILAVIPAETAFILVDDGQWGSIRALSDHRVFPFREHDSVYWGPPGNDAEARDEVERLRRAGAAFIVFAWPSFWWLDHYSEFSRWLRAEFSCVLENERMIIFELPTLSN